MMINPRLGGSKEGETWKRTSELALSRPQSEFRGTANEQSSSARLFHDAWNSEATKNRFVTAEMVLVVSSPSLLRSDPMEDLAQHCKEPLVGYSGRW